MCIRDRFKTIFETSEKNESGIDKVVFKIKTNPKSDLGDIKSISSGGELCRIALAIKVTAEKNNAAEVAAREAKLAEAMEAAIKKIIGSSITIDQLNGKNKKWLTKYQQRAPKIKKVFNNGKLALEGYTQHDIDMIYKKYKLV